MIFFSFTNTEQNLYYQHNNKKNVSVLLEISEIWLQICHFKTELPGTGLYFALHVIFYRVL